MTVPTSIRECQVDNTIFDILARQRPEASLRQFACGPKPKCAIPQRGEEPLKTAKRSYTRIDASDLQRLAKLAAKDRKSLFERNPRLARLYSNRLVCVALCQGAALHFFDGKNGINDFDVWSFYAEHTERPFPYRRNAPYDFGDPKFGRSHLSPPGYIGKRVDMLGRSIRCAVGADPRQALRKYLSEGKTKSARCLAQKAVVLLEPSRLRGFIVWPVQH